ncbi:UNVERIFIED_CONTAM: hypothetical protein Slati_2502600 [Sesamum latifolium]|uniref:Uncharacterized protein n=1 Tax=Sesamum latifolium TaxID=2727402 RepID=A0AAW2WG21_9LAMI
MVLLAYLESPSMGPPAIIWVTPSTGLFFWARLLNQGFFLSAFPPRRVLNFLLTPARAVSFKLPAWIFYWYHAYIPCDSCKKYLDFGSWGLLLST